jgi:bifunctional DNA-binding transcriptional regulator/antitoxin component of YhaV-PrlF toxin-antitoxin module
MTALIVTKRGTITLPAALRKKWSGGRPTRLHLLLEEREGGVLLSPVKRMVGRKSRVPVVDNKRQDFIKRLNAEYTQEVCAETLRINEEYPIHDEAP